MMFHQTFPSYPCIHKDKHLFLITKQIYLNYYCKIGIYLGTFWLILVLFFSILCICKLIYYFLTQQNSILNQYLFFFVHDLHSILLKIPNILSTNSDNEVDINLKLSINLSLHAIVSEFSYSFLKVRL